LLWVRRKGSGEKRERLVGAGDFEGDLDRLSARHLEHRRPIA
jgi:hypothetical protein